MEMPDEISNSLSCISESSWISDEDSMKLKTLKKRVNEVYAKYKKAVDNG